MTIRCLWVRSFLKLCFDVSRREELNPKHHQDAYQHLRLKIVEPCNHVAHVAVVKQGIKLLFQLNSNEFNWIW